MDRKLGFGSHGREVGEGGEVEMCFTWERGQVEEVRQGELESRG